MNNENMNVLDQFRIHLKNFENWRHNLDESVSLIDPDYVVEQRSAGPHEELGSQWWGYHLRRKQKTYRYSLQCKGKEVCTIPMVSFENEEFAIPFPNRHTIVDPRDKPSSFDIDQFCDIWYFDTESLAYSLLYYIRRGENMTTPLRSSIKPGIVSLPILFLAGENAVDQLIRLARQRLEEFPKYKTKKWKDREISYEFQERHQSEKLFSEWVLEISKNP